MNSKDKKTSDPSQVLIAGEAGQGVVVQGILLAQAAVASGAWVAQSARYGAAMRGGVATADVVISKTPIDFPHVESPDFAILISQLTYDANIDDPNLKVVVFDDFFVKPRKNVKGKKQFCVSATEISINTFKNAQPSNLMILAAFAEATQIVSLDDIITAMDENLAARFREVNMKAMEIGVSIIRKTMEVM